MPAQSVLAMALALLDALVPLLARIPALQARYDELKARVRIIVEEDREPTDEEWQEFFSKHEQLRARLKDANDGGVA